MATLYRFCCPRPKTLQPQAHKYQVRDPSCDKFWWNYHVCSIKWRYVLSIGNTEWQFSTALADWAVFGSTDFFAIFLIAKICYFWRCFSSFHGQNQYKIRVSALRTKKLNNIKVRNRTIYVYCTTWYKSLLWRGLSFRVNVQHLTNQSKLTTH